MGLPVSPKDKPTSFVDAVAKSSKISKWKKRILNEMFEKLTTADEKQSLDDEIYKNSINVVDVKMYEILSQYISLQQERLLQDIPTGERQSEGSDVIDIPEQEREQEEIVTALDVAYAGADQQNAGAQPFSLSNNQQLPESKVEEIKQNEEQEQQRQEQELRRILQSQQAVKLFERAQQESARKIEEEKNRRTLREQEVARVRQLKLQESIARKEREKIAEATRKMNEENLKLVLTKPKKGKKREMTPVMALAMKLTPLLNESAAISKLLVKFTPKFIELKGRVSNMLLPEFSSRMLQYFEELKGQLSGMLNIATEGFEANRSDAEWKQFFMNFIILKLLNHLLSSRVVRGYLPQISQNTQIEIRTPMLDQDGRQLYVDGDAAVVQVRRSIFNYAIDEPENPGKIIVPKNLFDDIKTKMPSILNDVVNFNLEKIAGPNPKVRQIYVDYKQAMNHLDPDKFPFGK